MAGKQLPFPINYRGKALKTPKTGNRLSAHSCLEDEALDKIERHMVKVGITRLANITGLDRHGIPVVNSIKPSINGFSVQHGKGMTLKTAKISAAMESFERFFGVGQDLSSFRMTYRELEKKYNVIPYENLALSKDSLFHMDLPIDWTLGWDIVNHEDVAVPLELATLNYDSAPGEWRLFQMSSNGLSAGFEFLEAVSQALFEVVERDAITCSMHGAKAVDSPFPLKRIQVDTIRSTELANLLKQLESADILPVLFDCRLDTETPVFKCYCLDKLDPTFGVCYGMGASLDPEEAMARAITEACQPRAIFISGARDMFFHEDFKRLKSCNVNLLVEAFESQEGEIDFSSIPTEAAETFEEDINICIEKIKAVGLHQVIIFRLTELEGIEVAKVVVPGLEGYMLPDYAPGPRANAYLGGKKYESHYFQRSNRE